jgi:hypothetical protein
MAALRLWFGTRHRVPPCITFPEKPAVSRVYVGASLTTRRHIRRDRNVNIVTCMRDSRRGFGLDVVFIDHFKTQFVIPLKYSVIANFHKLNRSLADTLDLFQPAVFTNSCLVTASNSGCSTASALASCLNGGCFPTACFCN